MSGADPRILKGGGGSSGIFFKKGGGGGGGGGQPLTQEQFVLQINSKRVGPDPLDLPLSVRY